MSNVIMDHATAAPTPAAPAAAAAAAPEKGKIGGILGIVLPALLAGAASFAATRLAPAHSPQPAVEDHGAVAHPPGPTVALEPFLVQVTDTNKKTHPMKVVLAIEFSHAAKEEELKGLVPRIRDATLTYLRGLTFEEAADRVRITKARDELLVEVKKCGADSAERVLITDFVIQ